MKLTILVDNTTIIDRYYLGEPGFSCLLGSSGTRILFDTGYSGVFIDNAAALGLDLASVDAVVISHGHDDHSGGLRHWVDRFPAAPSVRRPLLVAHPRAFDPKRSGDLSIGSPISLPELASHFEPRFSSETLDLGGGFMFLGEIPRHGDVEGISPIGETTGPAGTIPDLLPDDTAIAWKGDEGIVVITGCSHAGIVNIVEHAVKVCGDDRIVDIIGGFHLLGASADRLNYTTSRLGALRPRAMHPCHCTDFAARMSLAASLPVSEVGVGLELSYR
jgi:7,8-dihydropterin-6-yl-methyl-4-(beta-D-ribofuranosyl)aminobenzene 5'-phosphate synthase